MKSTVDIPDHWVLASLGDVVEFGGAGVADPDEISSTSWILELEDIEPRTGRLLKQLTAGERHPKSVKAMFSPGCVLYGRLRPYLGKVLVADQEGYCSTEIIPLKPYPEVSAEYLYYWLRGSVFGSYAVTSSHGTNMPRLGTDAAKRAPIYLPPLAEQQRIAIELSHAFDELNMSRQLLHRAQSKLREVRVGSIESAVSGQLTSKFREMRDENSSDIAIHDEIVALPPGYNRLSKRLPTESSLEALREQKPTKIPPSWSVRSVRELYDLNILIDFADGNHGSMYPRQNDFGADGVAFLTASQIDDNWQVDVASCPRLRQEKADLITKGWAVAGDVLLTHNAVVGRVAILPETDGAVLLGTSVTFYRFNSEYLLPEYVRIYFASSSFQTQLQTVMKQTTRNQVPLSTQTFLYIVCPPADEQRQVVEAITEILDDIDNVTRLSHSISVELERSADALIDAGVSGKLAEVDERDSRILLDTMTIQSRAQKRPRRTSNTPARPRIKKNAMDRHQIQKAHLRDIVREKGPLVPEDLWAASKLSIDDFYDQMRLEESGRLIVEVRDGPQQDHILVKARDYED